MTGFAVSRNPKTPLWDTDVFQLTEAQRNACPQFREVLRTSSSELAHYLADVTPASRPGGFSRKQMTELEREITKGCTKADAIFRLRFLKKIVFDLNRLFQKSIPQPALLARMVREDNPIVEEAALSHLRVHFWMKCQQGWVKRLCPTAEDRALRAPHSIPPSLIVFTAALYDGLLNQDSAIALVDNLLAPGATFDDSGDRLYTDLVLPANEDYNREVRRWYPGPRSASLIARVCSASAQLLAANKDGEGAELARDRKERITKAIYQEIAAELQPQRHAVKLPRRFDATQLVPNSLKEIFATIAQVLHSEIPAFLVKHGTRESGSRSLSPRCVERITGMRAIRAIPALPSVAWEDVANLDGLHQDIEEESQSELAPEWVEPLRASFRAKDRHQIQSAIRKVLDDMGLALNEPAGKKVVEFAGHLLQCGSSSGASLRSKTIASVVFEVARRYACIFGKEDPQSFSPRTLETQYIEVLDNLAVQGRPQARPRVAWALREFHRFLVSEHKVEPINESVAFRVARGLLPVDSRIISLDDCFRTVDRIDDLCPEPMLKAVAKAELIFGFFAGLRRMEGLGLRTVDLPGGNHCPVFVRASEERPLKTPNATRWIPMSVFTPPELLKSIYAWIRQPADCDASQKQGRALFGDISDNAVIPVIHQALQEVTQDNTMHYHVLRHSFATWTFLRLMLADLPQIPEVFRFLNEHHPRTAAWLRTSKRFRTGLYGNDLVTNDHAWAVGSLLGHSSPSVSATHYLHCLDILLALFLEQNETFGKYKDQELIYHAGLADETGYGRLRSFSACCTATNSAESLASEDQAPALASSSAAGEAPLVSNGENSDLPKLTPLETQWVRRRLAFSVFRNRLQEGPFNVADNAKESLRNWLQDTYDLLFYTEVAKQRLYNVAAPFGFSIDVARRLLARTEQVGAILLPGGSYAFPMVTWPLGRASLFGRERLRCPVPPHSDRSRERVNIYADRLNRVAQKYSELVAGVLEHYVHHTVKDSPALVVHAPADPAIIKRYIRFLGKMEFRRDTLTFRSCDESEKATPSRKWIKAWGLDWRDRVHNESAGAGKSRRKNNERWLSIEPTFSPEDIKDESEAFRFVMLMGAIRFS